MTNNVQTPGGNTTTAGAVEGLAPKSRIRWLRRGLIRLAMWRDPEARLPKDQADARASIAESICQTVAEIPDRSSPDDWPEAMLVTADELHTIVVCALESEAERQAHSLPGDVGTVAYMVASIRQGRSDTPRCEPPGQYVIDRAKAEVKDVFEALAALTPSALSGDAGEVRTIHLGADDGHSIGKPDDLSAALSKIMPIVVENGPDYATVHFGDGEAHRSQTMTMNPQDWLDIQAAFEASHQGADS